MARPKAKELTERGSEIMHIFWDRGESTAADIRDALESQGGNWPTQPSQRWSASCSTNSF